MTVQLKVPSVGESVVEATVGEWLKKEGDYVEKDALVVTLESEKATFELPAPAAGVLRKILVTPGTTIPIGTVIAELDETAAPGAASSAPAAAPAPKPAAPAAPLAAAPAVAPSAVPVAAAPAPSPSATTGGPAGPSVQRQAALSGVDLGSVAGSGNHGRILKEDVLAAATAKPAAPSPAAASPPAPAAAVPATAATPYRPASRGPSTRTERVVRMSPLRRTVAARLVQVQNDAAILTTFNEVDMSGVMALREKYKEGFEKKHGVKLGFMGFFVKGAIEALKAFPAVNAEIRGDDMVYKEFYDVGVAVGGGKGLVVPVIRNADALSFAELEKTISDFGKRARDNKLALDELQGGTFTISNGGVYGSMMSTPILNPPQTGILGMHNIMQRPVAVNGEVVIRPMMYLALSYDHRAIDGREAVQFLIRIKECVENPERLLLEV